jgi:predicted lactoylglutathione lyase
MIDHCNLPVSDLAKSRAFYEAVLATLEFPLLAIDADAAGFGCDSWAFGIVQAELPISRIHVAFKACSHAAVKAFYDAALRAGAQSNGLPGFRPHYGPTYYSAFVYDLDGHNVEAVCRLVSAD